VAILFSEWLIFKILLCNRVAKSASYQVSDQLAKQFQRKRFLEINQTETRIACGGHVC
jgi:hypothetical protein